MLVQPLYRAFFKFAQRKISNAACECGWNLACNGFGCCVFSVVHKIYNLVCYSLTFYTRFVHSVLLATIFINQEGKRVRRTELAKKSYIHKFRYSFIYKDCDVDNVFWHAIYNNWQNSVTTINNDKIAYRMPFLLFVVSLHSTSQNIHTISEYTHFRRAAILFRCLAYHPG